MFVKKEDPYFAGAHPESDAAIVFVLVRPENFIFPVLLISGRNSPIRRL